MSLARHWKAPRQPSHLDAWAFPLACERGELEVAKTIAERATQDGTLDSLRLSSALTQSCRKGASASVQWLLETFDGLSPFLYRAAEESVLGDAPEALHCLLVHDPLATLSPPVLAESWSPQLIACHHGRLDCLRALLPHYSSEALRARYSYSAGDIHQPHGGTFLMAAAHSGNIECIRALIPHSDVLATNEEGQSALQFHLMWHRSAECVDALAVYEPLETIEQLMARLDAQEPGFSLEMPQCRAKIEHRALSEGGGGNFRFKRNRSPQRLVLFQRQIVPAHQHPPQLRTRPTTLA